MKGRHALAAACLAIYGFSSPQWLAVLCYIAALAFLIRGYFVR